MDGLFGEPRHRGTDHLHEPPAGRRPETHLDRQPDVLLVNAGQGPEHEFEILGVDEVEPRGAHRFLERAADILGGGTVGPQHPTLSVDDHRRIGLLGEQSSQKGFVGAHLLSLDRSEGPLEPCPAGRTARSGTGAPVGRQSAWSSSATRRFGAINR